MLLSFDRIIITGASSGFGEAYARRLAAGCKEMVLIARRVDRLDALKDELEAQHRGLSVLPICCDLSDAAARELLLGRLSCLPPMCTLLINNAGMGDYGAFADSDPARNHLMMEVNMTALTHLTRALLPPMLAKGGAVMNVASLAADVFIPDFAIYAASKSYVASFSEALHIELKEQGVGVLAVCPGPVHTEFGQVARREGFTGNMTPGKDAFDSSVTTVVEGSLRALAAGKSRYYPSLKIRVLALLLRNLPLGLLRFVLAFRPRRVQSDSV